MAQFKSLVRLRMAIDSAAPNITFALVRVDQRRFLLSSTDTPEISGTPRNGFVYDRGFVAAAQPVRNSRPSRHLTPWNMGLIAVIAVATIWGSITLGTNSYVKPTAAHPLTTAHHTVKNINSNATSATCPTPEDQANQATARAKMPSSVVGSQIIGGFREVTLVSDCDKKQYQVIMYLTGNTWKAESATPTGSHSLSGK